MPNDNGLTRTLLENIISDSILQQYDDPPGGPAEPCHSEQVENGILLAAKKIFALHTAAILPLLSQRVEWYKPEAQLPEHKEQVWICVGDNAVIFATFYNYPKTRFFFDVINSDPYEIHQVYAWMPFIIPQPPPQ